MKTKTIEQIDARLDEIRTEARGLVDTHGEIRDGDCDRFDALTAEADQLKADRATAQARIAHMRELAGKPGHLEHGSDQGVPQHRPITQRDTALRTIERNHTGGYLGDNAAATAENLVERSEQAQDWVCAAGSQEYASAFAKLVRDTDRGHMLWTAQEQDAFGRAQVWQRAMAIGSDPTGGVMVPLYLDPAIILTDNGSVSPLRNIARVVQITSNVWHGVSSDGASSEWTPEAAEVADGSPTLAQPVVPVHKYDCFVAYSVEAEGDAQNLLAELQRAIIDSVGTLHNEAYTTGSGTDQPTGIVTALAASDPSVVVPGASTNAYSPDDPYALQNALGARYQPNAQFTAALPVINAYRRFETVNGTWQFPELRQTPPMLLGRAVNENSVMDAELDGPAAEDYALIYGDFQNFVIADRVGTTVELVPHVFGPNRRPTLQRGLLLWGRTGSDSVNDNAFRMLSVSS
ncbi:phage major capsid protein [Rhodococcus sp. HM1]|uniref:phage major capsid protein n=1 Tax=Rhodococcus sp. HM1 TaxID=2937759 RepID=UPI00200A47CB|nr:phage major capsid protein [Rhodococcus sp. HM1]MCK8673280.1 phage major capsid protein [Rhodococcus sp. HM1]